MDKFLLYYRFGILNVVKGDIEYHEDLPFPTCSFISEDDNKKYTMVSDKPLEFSCGKIWCYQKDLKKALKIMKKHRKEYVKYVKSRADKLCPNDDMVEYLVKKIESLEKTIEIMQDEINSLKGGD